MGKCGFAFTMAVLIGISAAAFAQGTTQPSAPVDPTAQTPGAPAGSTPPTFPDSGVKGDSSSAEGSPSTPSATTTDAHRDKVRPFKGTIVQQQDAFILRSGDLDYKIDDQDQARKYSGKSVKISGSLDKKSNTIHVKKIESAPSS